jgi:hypothetical protein
MMIPVPALFRVSLRAAALAAGAGAAGCAHQSEPIYAWSHAASGEYLFAFDVRECGESAGTARTLIASAAMPPTGSPEFFACMRDRGYFLVDPTTGLPLTADSADRPLGAYAPQAAR